MRQSRYTQWICILLACIQPLSGAIFDFRPPAKDDRSPLTGFFSSMYADKEIVFDRFGIKAIIDGYVIHEPFWDTRQVVSEDEGNYLFYPAYKDLDPLGKDINSNGNVNMVNIETRTRISVYGPKIGNAESFAYIETDFIGDLDLADTMRARLAFFSLNWQESDTHLIFGQFYHPARLAHLDIDTKVVAFNVAAPIHPDAFNPQIRYTKALTKNLHLIACAYTQLLQMSFGPEGQRTIYLRRSRIPDINLQLWVGPHDRDHVIGVAADVKRLIPRLTTDTGLVAHESIVSCAFYAFAKYTAYPYSVRTQLTWAQNGPDYHLLGGYAVNSIDPVTDRRTYTNITFLTYWVDLNRDTRISPGLLFGVAKNMSTHTCIIPYVDNLCTQERISLVYARGPEIHYMIKIMPRIRVHFKPMIFAAELDWSWIRYGCITDFGCNRQPTETVNNARFLFATYFFFRLYRILLSCNISILTQNL